MAERNERKQRDDHEPLRDEESPERGIGESEDEDEFEDSDDTDEDVDEGDEEDLESMSGSSAGRLR